MFPERPQLVFLSPERGSIDIDAQLASLQESGFFVTDVCPPQKQKALTFTEKSLAFDVKESPRHGWGKGWLANRAINEGTLLVMEPSILVQPVDFPSAASTLDIVNRVRSLSEDRQVAYFALDKTTRSVEKKNWVAPCDYVDPQSDTILSIFNASALQVANSKLLTGSRAVRGVFQYASRINHSCSPNLRLNYDHFEDLLTVHTLRDIQPGEELTISYVDPVNYKSTRQSFLLKRFGFKCLCSACKKGPQSDNNRARLCDWVRDLRTWEATQPDEQFKRATELIAEFELIVQPGGVLDIEDLQGRRMMFFLHAMPLAATHSDSELTKLIARGLIKCGNVEHGFSNNNFAWSRIAEDPRASDSWEAGKHVDFPIPQGVRAWVNPELVFETSNATILNSVGFGEEGGTSQGKAKKKKKKKKKGKPLAVSVELGVVDGQGDGYESENEVATPTSPSSVNAATLVDRTENDIDDKITPNEDPSLSSPSNFASSSNSVPSPTESDLQLSPEFEYPLKPTISPAAISDELGPDFPLPSLDEIGEPDARRTQRLPTSSSTRSLDIWHEAQESRTIEEEVAGSGIPEPRLDLVREDVEFQEETFEDSLQASTPELPIPPIVAEILAFLPSVDVPVSDGNLVDTNNSIHDEESIPAAGDEVLALQHRSILPVIFSSSPPRSPSYLQLASAADYLLDSCDSLPSRGDLVELPAPSSASETSEIILEEDGLPQPIRPLTPVPPLTFISTVPSPTQNPGHLALTDDYFAGAIAPRSPTSSTLSQPPSPSLNTVLEMTEKPHFSGIADSTPGSEAPSAEKRVWRRKQSDILTPLQASSPPALVRLPPGIPTRPSTPLATPPPLSVWSKNVQSQSLGKGAGRWASSGPGIAFSPVPTSSKTPLAPSAPTIRAPPISRSRSPSPAPPPTRSRKLEHPVDFAQVSLEKLVRTLEWAPEKVRTAMRRELDRIESYPAHLPLSCGWTLFFSITPEATASSKTSTLNYSQERTLLFSETTCPGLCSSLKTLQRHFFDSSGASTLVSSLKSGASLSFFRQGIQPIWEDPSNLAGGRLTFHAPRDRQLDALFHTLVFLLAGSTIEDMVDKCLTRLGSTRGPEGIITGAVVAARKPPGGEKRFEIWVAGPNSNEAPSEEWVSRLKEVLTRELEIVPVVKGPPISYRVHFPAGRQRH